MKIYLLQFDRSCATTRESSFNMTRGDKDIEGGLKVFRHSKEGSLKTMFGQEGAHKICILQKQHMSSSYRLDGRHQSRGRHSATINT